jgi:hypothetical protein
MQPVPGELDKLQSFVVFLSAELTIAVSSKAIDSTTYYSGH